MLNDLIPQSWELAVFLLPYIIFGLIMVLSIVFLNTKINICWFRIIIAITLSLFNLSLILILPGWKYRDEFNLPSSLINFFRLIFFSFLTGYGIYVSIKAKKDKNTNYLIAGIVCILISLFGFALSLFKVLQMFKVVV